MVNQKLVFHVVVYERDFGELFFLGKQVLVEEFLHYWCRQNQLLPFALSAQPDHLHLLVEQKNELAINRIISRLLGALEQWPTESHPKKVKLGYGLFTVSFVALNQHVRFVESQNQHHMNVSFEDEFTSMVDKHDVALSEIPNQSSHKAATQMFV